MKKITLFLLLMFMGVGVYAQCPIPSTSFVGDYNIVQTTPNNPFLNAPAFDDQVISLTIGATPNSRVFSAIYAESAGIGQPPMDVSFTLDCPNGSNVIVDAGLDTLLTCDQLSNITLGPAPTTGTFDQNDDSTFTLILEEFQNLGGCPTTPATVEFTLTKANCAAPQGVTVSNITTNSADVSWTDVNGAGTTFDVEYGFEGFATGSGTIITGISATSTTLPNLQLGNFYDVYVSSNCGADSSINAGPITFLMPTDCAAEFSGFPIVENFDDPATFASCYTVIDEDGNGNAWIQEELELQPLTPSFFSTNGTNNAQKEDYLISPAFSLTAGNTYDISATYNGADAANGTANEDLEVIVATGTTVADANSGTSVFADNGIVQNGAFADLETQALTSSGQFTPTTSGDYHIVFKSTGSPVQLGGTTGFILLFEYSIDETLSTEQFDAFNFDYFVDNQSMLNLSANQTLDQVVLHNLLGQQVISKKLSNQRESVDLNNLSNGVYLAKVQINNASKTFKIIKK